MKTASQIEKNKVIILNYSITGRFVKIMIID